jgi:hypothetical protein
MVQNKHTQKPLRALMGEPRELHEALVRNKQRTSRSLPDNFELLLECYAHGLGSNLPRSIRHTHSHLLDRFFCVFVNTCGGEILALALSMAIEKKPRTPLALRVVFQDFNARFFKRTGLQAQDRTSSLVSTAFLICTLRGPQQTSCTGWALVKLGDGCFLSCCWRQLSAR